MYADGDILIADMNNHRVRMEGCAGVKYLKSCPSISGEHPSIRGDIYAAMPLSYVFDVPSLSVNGAEKLGHWGGGIVYHWHDD